MMRRRIKAVERTPRAAAAAAAQARARRTLAAARLRVCANVFARSRIHFDPRRAPAPGAAAIDRAPVRRCAPDCADRGSVMPQGAARAAEFLIH